MTGMEVVASNPSSGCEKIYVATLRVCGSMRLRATAAAEFASGRLTLADGHVCEPAGLEVLETVADPDSGASEPPFARRVRVTVREGKYHQIKRMLGACGAAVEGLHRESIGGIALKDLDLPEGAVMEAGTREVALLRAMLPAQRVVSTAPASTSHRWSRLVKLMLLRHGNVPAPRHSHVGPDQRMCGSVLSVAKPVPEPVPRTSKLPLPPCFIMV